ncbi:sigma-54-dependent Fis family transcriptional regulator [Desulforhopalus vacuolatus]|uniref:sigma-54-dependent transcriptional regulator n=1 Tax=Desulforhopalus vacuolatus TaxID=40414 RepID=UPI0019633866|nr:sigma-54-dependent Fis family transcriptional regulator [Desulforhopalus vacuolatus]
MGAMSEKETTILVVDDDQAHRYMLCSMLRTWGWRTVEADDGVTAVAAVENHTYDAVLMDVRMTKMDGHTAFRHIHEMHPELPVVIMTAYSTVDDAVEAIQQGAHDYLTKPLDFERLRLALSRAVDLRQVQSRQEEKHGRDEEQGRLDTRIIGESPRIQDLLEMISYVAPTEASVLICGESGTGKELVAETLYRNSERSNGPFVTVNCAALAEGVLESELFGHEKGAFTGAESRREGKFVQADGGTLFLDEIGETTQAMQVKLLRVLQERELQRVGGSELVQVDVRILAATNLDLEKEVADGHFREDLYYRLNVVMLTVPPLRERGDDLELLTRFFAEKYAKKNRRQLDGISPECLNMLRSWSWPGNVRELENAIERGIILMRGTELTEKSLPLTVQRGGSTTAAPVAGTATLEEAEKRFILKTLEETGGNKSEASRRLGITRKTLLNKLNRYEEQG